MPTLTELIETPQAFSLETVTNENPHYIDQLIEFITVPPNILISNQRECYLYPSKVSDMLSTGMAYRILIQRKQVKEEQTYYYLQKLFENINREEADPTLLGYCCKVLISLVKKTPQIYEFVKDNQNFILQILKEDEKMDGLKEFLSFFLSESTMELYVFLKSMVIRNIIFRIIQDENVSPSVYKCIDYFYQHILKCLEDVAEDQKPELLEVCKNLQDEHFITLLILKLESGANNRNVYIGNFLYRALSRSSQVCELVSLQADTILDFLQDYEQSSIFMEHIRPEHLAVLKMLIELLRLNKINEDLTAQVIKRLMVYSNVHANNSVVHNLLMKGISYCRQQSKFELLHDLNIISFFCKSQTSQKYGFMSLRRRIFAYWVQHHLDKDITAEERQLISKDHRSKAEAIENSKFYKDFKINSNSKDLGSTGLPSDLAAMAIKT